MKVALLVVTIMVGLTAAGKRHRMQVYAKLLNDVNNTLYAGIRDDCRKALVAKYPSVNDGLIEDSATRKASWKAKGLLATGCVFKKFFLDLEGKIPEGDTPEKRESFQLYLKCLRKHNKRAKGDYEALGKYLVDSNWCDAEDPDTLAHVKFNTN